MTIATASPMRAYGLLKELRTAQEALHRPEVQAMLRKLSEYHLGIFMPHMHDELTGDFQRLPNDVVQVESDLEVSFRPATDIAHQADRFLPVGWSWRNGASTPVAVCEMVWDERSDDTARQGKHKMIKRT